MLPVPSWSDRKNSRPPISIGLASCPPRSARTRVNRGSSPVATHSLPARPPRYRFQNAGSPPTLPVSNAVPASSMARSLTSPYGSGRGGGAPRPGGLLAGRRDGQYLAGRRPPGDPGLRVAPEGEPGRVAALGIGGVDLGLAVPPAGPRDRGPIPGEARVADRGAVGGQPPGAAARGGREPDVVASHEGDQVTVDVRVTQVASRHHAAPPGRGPRGGSGGRALFGWLTDGPGGVTAGCFSSASSARRTAVSSCGSRPAAQSSGEISTSTSGSTP